MSASYYVNRKAQANGDHEVHDATCKWLPADENRQYLGYFASCTGAVTEARRYFVQVNGCIHCSTTCHTQ